MLKRARVQKSTEKSGTRSPKSALLSTLKRALKKRGQILALILVSGHPEKSAKNERERRRPKKKSARRRSANGL